MMSTINTDSSVYEALGLARELEEENQNELALEDFLELMVTELTHQDPFKPMENTELATQISQFATVSGIDELNQSFTDLSGSLLSDQALQAANLVGRDVLVPSDVGYYTTGSTLDGVVDLEQSASDVTLRVYNTSGSLVRELSLGTQTGGQVAFSWDGLMDDGDYAPSGQYYVTAEAEMDGETVAPYTLLEAKVSSVSVGAGQDLSLNLEGLGTISFNDVAEIH
jgi:flagellar basal-body rod modification protein FlgD